MRQNQKLSEEEINNVSSNTHDNPINSSKPVTRIYGGFSLTERFYKHKSNLDAMQIFSEFCTAAKYKKTVEDIFGCIHSIAINKLGYQFTALGLVKNQSNYLNIRLLDYADNVYSSKILLNETQNPLVDCFLNKKQKNVDNINFIKIHDLDSYPAVIIPLISQDECIGIFIAGKKDKGEGNDIILNNIASYLSLLILNRQLSEKINQSIDVDSLTGLKNHRDFQQRLSLEIRNANKNDKPVSIIMLDINNISQINREFGHAKGDDIISIVAERIAQNIRETDIAGRYGGDEIAVILPETESEEACCIAEYLNHSITCSPIDDIGTVRVSIGVATYPTCTRDQEKLLLLTEQAMFISKNKGYKNGKSSVVSANDIDFWNEMALNSFAAVVAKRHSQWGINFEDELVKKFHNERISSDKHLIEVATSLAGAIDAKDPYTKGHSQAVSKFSEALAREINLPEEEIERIKLGALLHDVGKIGIPGAILRKSTQLSDQEWEIMKQHPKIGVEKVLQPIESLRDLIPIVVHHHEHWNGTGYPDKLAGEKIPFEARIVSIADAFHSLISNRPYRKALDLEKAIEILKAGAGVQWDKKLVKAFLKIARSLADQV